MSFGYSTNQFENAFRAKELQNWHTLTRHYKGFPKSAKGFSQIFATDRGHLLEGVPRCSESPWGTFMSTWEMPLKIPPAHPKYTGRRPSKIKKLFRWRENSVLQNACNGFLEFPTRCAAIKQSEMVRPVHPSPLHDTPSQELIDDYQEEEVPQTALSGRPGFTPGPYGYRNEFNAPKVLPPISRNSEIDEERAADIAFRSESRLSQASARVRKTAFKDRYTESCRGVPRQSRQREVLKKGGEKVGKPFKTVKPDPLKDDPLVRFDMKTPAARPNTAGTQQKK